MIVLRPILILSWLIVVEGHPKATFSIATSPRCKGWRYFFPWISPLTLDTYLIMVSVKQEDHKYHFLSFW